MMDEAGRCRRTDGKKWRCSKAVIPNQKYCEKHMHRGCRSRKHIESPVYTSKIPLNLKPNAQDPPTDASNAKKADDSSRDDNGGVTKIVFKSASSATKSGQIRSGSQPNVGEDSECGYGKNKVEKLNPDEKNGTGVKDDGCGALQADEPESGMRTQVEEDSELRTCRKPDGKRGQCGEDEKHCKKLMQRVSKEATCGLPGS